MPIVRKPHERLREHGVFQPVTAGIFQKTESYAYFLLCKVWHVYLDQVKPRNRRSKTLPKIGWFYSYKVIQIHFYTCFRRCVHCSCRHCCNSWCKEEFVVVSQFLILVCVQLVNYLPMLQKLTKKLELDFWILDLVIPWVPSQISRAIEMSSGISLPILCYTFLPAYRYFCNEPDPDDLRLSEPRGKGLITEILRS